MLLVLCVWAPFRVIHFTHFAFGVVGFSFVVVWAWVYDFAFAAVLIWCRVLLGRVGSGGGICCALCLCWGFFFVWFEISYWWRLICVRFGLGCFTSTLRFGSGLVFVCCRFVLGFNLAWGF